MAPNFDLPRMIQAMGDSLTGAVRSLTAPASVAILTSVCLGLAPGAAVLGKGGVGIFLGLACIGALWSIWNDRRLDHLADLTRNIPFLLFALTMVWWLVSAGLSDAPEVSLAVWGRMVVFLAGAGCLFLFLADNPARRTLAVKSLVVGGILFFGYGAIATYVPAWTKPLELFRSAQSDSVAYFKASASVVALCVPVLVWAGLRYGGKWLPLAWGAILPGAVLIFGDGREPSRSAIAGLIGAVLLLLLVWALGRLNTAVRRTLVVGLVLGALGAGVWFVSSLSLGTQADLEAGSEVLPWPDRHRQAIWAFVRDKALEKPLFGHGIDRINQVDGAKAEVHGLNQEYIPAHPHNWVLEVVSETGIPGLALFLATIFSLLALAGRRFAIAPGDGFVALAVIGAFFVSSLSNFSFWSAWWQVVFLALLVLSTSISRESAVGEGARTGYSTGPRRLSMLATVIVLAVVAAMLFALWGARRTDEGRILYKRMTAKSEYVYDAIPPSFLETDPAGLIDIPTEIDLQAKRNALVQAIWGVPDIPRRLSDVGVAVMDGPDPYGLHGWFPERVDRIERVSIPYEFGYRSVAYVLVPKVPNGAGLVYAHGYAGDISQAGDAVLPLLELGYTVALLNFPGYGENELSAFHHPRFGLMARDHDLLLAIMDNPLRYYVDPIITMSDYLREAHRVDRVDAAGFSAGGWAVTVAAAADERLRRTVSVAGVLPLYLRLSERQRQWPPPHLYPPLLEAANYLEMFVLAGSGAGRGYLQVFNRFDRCCFRNRFGTLYEKAVSERIAVLATDGDFSVLIDETHADHRFSSWAASHLPEFLEPR